MPAVVNSVEKNSIADELGVLPNDEIISINGEKLCDLLDYRFQVFSEEIELHIKHPNGEEEIIEIEKDIDEDLGITFESAVFDRVIPCTNKCIFCFVDQQPKGLRQSLYVKDDDYRLSYLQGTYITLTNLDKKSRQRIENLRLGPLYVSVHTTNPDLRVKMLNNPNAASILKELKWLNSLDIPVHSQIVLCPEINDGKELENTLKDLTKLKSNIMSVAIVPVGVSKYREGDLLKPFDKSAAEKVIALAQNINSKLKYNLIFPSDEFYSLAEIDYPDYKFYNGFSQLDDGVGSTRIFLDDFQKRKKYLPKKINNPQKLTFVTGRIALDALNPIVQELSKIKNLKVDLVAIDSEFWGEKITVSGLITGGDLVKTLSCKKNLGQVVIPSVMLRKLTKDFLDGITLEDVEEKLNTKINVIKNYYSTEEIIELVNSFNS